MSNRRLLVCAALATAGAGVLGLALAQPQHATAGSATPPLAVRAVTVGTADDAASDSGGARYAATIRYDHEATLSFRLPGRITSLPLRPGDVVAAGALVATIEPDAYAAAAAMRAADAARTRRDADRIAGLVADGATSPAAAAAAQDAARGATAGLNAARYDLASTRLRSPFAALVLLRQAEAGETVGAGAAVLRVADRASALLAVADVPADVAMRLTRGTPARIWPAGATAPVTAQVWRVAGGADAKSGLVAVEVRLMAPIRLASGSPAAVGFAATATSGDARVAGAEPRQRIPAEALIDASANSADVWLIDGGGRAQRRTLRFYGFDDRDALVGGLPAGARVITTGAGFVAQGQQVAVIGA